MAFRVKCPPQDTPHVVKALKVLTDSDDETEIAEAVRVLRDRRWEVLTFKRQYAEPERIPTGEETFLDLHCVVREILKHKGAKYLFTLYDAYNIRRLSELRCCDYPQFMEDAIGLYHGIRTIFQHVD